MIQKLTNFVKNLIFLIMKKLFVLSLLTFGILSTYAQEKEIFQDQAPKNEFRVNALNLLLFKSLDVTYERALNEESSVGINTMFSLQGNDRFFDGDYIYYYEGFTLTPYYRLYFGKKTNAGFFAEAFMIYSSGKNDIYYYDYDTNTDYDYVFKSFQEFGVGFSIGTKLIAKRNIIANIHAGVARNFLDSKYGNGAAPRLSISFGWRY